MIGFRIRDTTTGAVKFSSEDLGLLFLDQFTVSAGATETRTYPNMAGSVVKVITLGANSIGANATITVTPSGTSMIVAVSVVRAGWFIVTRE